MKSWFGSGRRGARGEPPRAGCGQHVIVASGAAILALSAMGCCNMPAASPSTGAAGAFVRAIPEQGGLHAQALSGLVRPLAASPASGWPPEVLHDRCTSGQNEVLALEQSLGVRQIACPRFQLARAPEMAMPASMAVPADAGAAAVVADSEPGALPGDAAVTGPRGGSAVVRGAGVGGESAASAAGDAGPAGANAETPVGFDVRCYPLGSALLVVEATERLGDCSHIVGLAVFKKEP